AYVWDEDQSSEDDGQDLRGMQLKQLLREIVHRPPPLFRLEWAIDAATCSDDEAAVTVGQAQSPALLEKQLAAFIQSITHFPNNPATRSRISDAIGDDVYLDVMKSA